MTDFTFSAGGECEMCGAYLAAGDDDCDHDGREVSVHVFRRLRGGRDTLEGVESAPQYKWYKLAERVEDDWIAYQYIGTRDHVQSMLSDDMFGDIDSLPMREMALAAPNDVDEKI